MAQAAKQLRKTKDLAEAAAQEQREKEEEKLKKRNRSRDRRRKVRLRRQIGVGGWGVDDDYSNIIISICLLFCLLHVRDHAWLVKTQSHTHNYTVCLVCVQSSESTVVQVVFALTDIWPLGEQRKQSLMTTVNTAGSVRYLHC